MFKFFNSFLIIIFTVFPIVNLKSSENIQSLTTLENHTNFLKKVISEAEEEIIIVSPFISKNAIKIDDLDESIKEALFKGVKVSVYTDNKFDTGKSWAEMGREVLRNVYCDLHIVEKIHAKTLIVDDKILAMGSFNWLSAVRDVESDFANTEHTLILEGDFCKEHIERAKFSIEDLKEVAHPYRRFYETYIDGLFGDPTDLIEWWDNHSSSLMENNQKSNEELINIQKAVSEKISDFVDQYVKDEIEETTLRTEIYKIINPYIENILENIK